MPVDLRPLGIGDIFDASLRLYRRLLRVLVAIMAVSYGVVLPAVAAAVRNFKQNDAKVGDRVALVESRPLSRRKRWVVTRVVERAKEV